MNALHTPKPDAVKGSALSTSAPRHEHDCDQCVFLGHFGDADLYFHECANAVQTTVIARVGRRGAYASGLCFSAPYTDMAGEQQHGIPELVEARARAIAAGYGAAIAKATGSQP